MPREERPWESQFFAAWLQTKAANTRRAYRLAWSEFADFCRAQGADEIDRAVVALWQVDLAGRRGLSPQTVALKIAALSSFYRYQIDFGIGDRNPASRYTGRRPSPYRDPLGLSPQECHALLAATDRTTPQGKRDYAMILFYLATGRRNSEIRTLTRGDLRVRGGVVQYSWKNKGGDGWDECPPDVFQAIREYLDAAGRPFDGLAQDAPIFTALCENARRFPGVPGDWTPGATPLSSRYVLELVKKYAGRAGLGGSVRVHTLRHSAVGLMRLAGYEIEDIQTRLGHKDIKTTRLYMERREMSRNTYWPRVRGLISGVLSGGDD